MPQSDFKKEPTHARLKRIWFENYGNWLLATGLVVSLLAWSVGYFELYPEITAVRRTNTPSLMATGRTLVVHITGCQSDEGQIVAMLYDAEHFSADSTAIRVELLAIENGKATWPIHNLQFGSYIVLAFQDLDGDEQLDLGIERQGISRRAAAPHPLAPASDATPAAFEAAFHFNQDGEEVTVELKG